MGARSPEPVVFRDCLSSVNLSTPPKWLWKGRGPASLTCEWNQPPPPLTCFLLPHLPGEEAGDLPSPPQSLGEE